MADPKARIDILAIPDRADGEMLRLCVQMTPTAADCLSDDIPLDDWPAAVHGRSGAMRVWVAKLADGKPVDMRAIGVFAADISDIMKQPSAQAGKTIGDVAGYKWKTLFASPGFNALRSAIVGGGEPSVAECIRCGDAVGIAAPKIAMFDRLLDISYRRAVLGDDADLLATSELATSRLASAPFERGLTAPQFDVRYLADGGKLDFAACMPRAGEAIQLAAMRFYKPDRLAQHQHDDLLNACVLRAAALDLPDQAGGPLGAAIDELAILFAEAPKVGAEPPADPAVTDGETSMRKLNSLLAFPTLAKYFGMCADILLPANLLSADDFKGVIAIELKVGGAAFGVAPDPARLNWTAFTHRAPTATAPRFFGAWDGEGFRAENDPLPPFDQKLYLDGLLNLRQTIAGKPSFSLGSAEVVSTLARLSEIAGKNIGQVDRRTKGIMLYHEQVGNRTEVESYKNDPTKCDGKTININYADELRHGLRFDVQLLPKIGPALAGRWRPLMARTVEYSTDDVDARFLQDARVKALQYRDDGVAITPVAQQAFGIKTMFVASEELMVWGGGSLAVSATCDSAILDPNTDLAITVTFGLPQGDKASRLLPPPLRLGRRYAVRARVSMPMGCGMTYDDAQANPASDYSLPAPGTRQGFDYKLYEAIGAPIVAFVDDDRIVRTKGNDPTANGARTIEQLVVRANDAAFASDVRYILPARVSLDEAEQQGQFDEARLNDDIVPSGAFEGDAPIMLYASDGQLPEARAGVLTWIDPGTKTLKTLPSNAPASEEVRKAQTRGAVLVFGPAARSRPKMQQRYYPNRYARTLLAVLTRADGFAAPPTGAGTVKSVDFWKVGKPADTARPVLLQLNRGAPNSVPRVAVDTVTRTFAVLGSLTFRRITATLPPGQTVDLELFADPEDPEAKKCHHGAELIVNPLDYSVTESWSRRRQVSNTRTIRLVHAVKKPTPPRFAAAAGSIVINPVTVTVRPEGSPANEEIRTWRELANSGAPLKSEAGGTTTYFTGVIKVGGLTTHDVRCEARWDDYGTSTIKRHPVTQDWIRDHPGQFAELFAIKQLKSTKVDLEIDLLRHDRGDQLRELSYAFKDGGARRLRMRLVATSRFANYYPLDSAPDDDIDTLGPFDSASHKFDDAPVVWINCTFRPPPPVVDRVLPVLFWDFPPPANRQIGFSRRSKIRLSIDTEWYASGEGEMIALIFDQIEARPFCTPDTPGYNKPALSPFDPFVTRWGRDPIRSTAYVEPIGIDDIEMTGEGGSRIYRELKLYTNVEKGTKQNSLPVRIVAVEPKLDTELGLYCDISIGPKNTGEADFLRSYMPFVQLGLARFQPNAVDALKLSNPVQVMAQLLPDRSGYVELDGVDARKLKVSVTGPIFGGGQECGGPPLKIRLMERAQINADRSAWVPATDASNREVVLEQPPEPLSDSQAIGIWRLSLTLPQSRNAVHYGVLIEEYELLPADPLDLDQNAPSGDDPLEGTVFTRRGPLFETMIDLRRT